MSDVPEREEHLPPETEAPQEPGPGTRTYSYDPARLNAAGVDRLRFELGDTTLAPGELTAALCDEEYLAVLEQDGDWESVKLRCLRLIVMRFSHQVTMSVDGLRYDFSDRVQLWRAMLKEAEKRGRAPLPIPGGCGGSPYFYGGMLANPRKG